MNSTDGVPDSNCNIWWLSCADEDGCLDHVDCGGCTSALNCGWCDGRTCLSGTAEGATGAECQQWSYGESANCTMVCEDYADCASCTTGLEHLSCGWCNSTSKCVAGTTSGPSQAQCEAWFWGTCASSGEVINCSAHQNCTSCTGDPSDACGWCASTGECLKIEGATCEDFKDHKTCGDSCLDFSSNCSACSTNVNCGWCSDRSLCVEGTEDGPSYTNCSEWGFGSCSPAVNDTCAQVERCSDCIHSNGSCGWCDNGVNSGCTRVSDKGQCQGQWRVDQCTSYVFSCASLVSCDECVNYPPGECVWCAGEGACRLAIEVGTSCEYSCGSKGINMGPGVITAIVLVCVAVVGLSMGLWYRFYWRRRHYYERLR